MYTPSKIEEERRKIAEGNWTALDYGAALDALEEKQNVCEVLRDVARHRGLEFQKQKERAEKAEADAEDWKKQAFAAKTTSVSHWKRACQAEAKVAELQAVVKNRTEVDNLIGTEEGLKMVCKEYAILDRDTWKEKAEQLQAIVDRLNISEVCENCVSLATTACIRASRLSAQQPQQTQPSYDLGDPADWKGTKPEGDGK